MHIYVKTKGRTCLYYIPRRFSAVLAGGHNCVYYMRHHGGAKMRYQAVEFGRNWSLLKFTYNVFLQEMRRKAVKTCHFVIAHDARAPVDYSI